MPMRFRFANGSKVSEVSVQTRLMIAPTVRHAIRINSMTVLLEVWVTSPATCWSKTICMASRVADPGNSSDGDSMLGISYPWSFGEKVRWKGSQIHGGHFSGTPPRP